MKPSILLLAALLLGCGTTVSGITPDAGTTLDAGPSEDVPAPPRDLGSDGTTTDVRDVPIVLDAPLLCQRTLDCPAGLRCVYTATGACGESDNGVCRDTAGCESLPVAPQYCGCDGRTFTIPSACPPDRPFLADGPCPVRDAGTGEAGTGDAVVTDGGQGRYADARMVWQSPGGVVGWGPAVMVLGDGTVRGWVNVTEFDALGTPPAGFTETRVTTAQVDDLFGRWDRAVLTALPHGPTSFNECYPSVTVARCATCMPLRIMYNHPDQLTPEMNDVWAWFRAHTPGVEPGMFCRFQ